MDGNLGYTSHTGKPLINVKNRMRPGTEYLLSEAKAQIEGYSGSTCKSHATVELAHASLCYAQAYCKSPQEPTDDSDGLEYETTLIKEMARTTL